MPASSADSGDIVLRPNATMAPVHGFIYKAAIDLGPLEERRQVQVRARIKNPTSTNFRVVGTDSSCRCAAITADGNVLRGNATTEVSWTFSTGAFPSSGDPAKSFSVSLEFASPEPTDVGAAGLQIGKDAKIQSRLHIVCEYSYKGALGFRGRTVIVEVGKSEEAPEIELPITVTPPLAVDDTELVCSVDSSYIEWHTESRDNRPVVVGIIRERGVDEAPYAGVLELRSLQVPKTAEIQFVVRVRDSATVAPNVVTFRPTEDQKGFYSSWIVHLLDKGKEPELLESASISCSVGTQKVDPQFFHLGGGVYRVKMQVDSDTLEREIKRHRVDEEDSDEPPPQGTLNWIIETPDNSYKLASYFFVDASLPKPEE